VINRRISAALLNPALLTRERFMTIWNGSVRWFLEHPHAYRYVQQVRDSGLISEKVVQESNSYFSYYYEAIQQGLQENQVRPYPLPLIGAFLYHDIAAVTNMVLTLPHPADQDEIIRLGFEIFWDGIKSRQ
jgi:hypothetical protein